MTIYHKSRRNFLKDSLVAAATGIAVPYVAGTQVARGATPGSDRLTVAAIGVGRRGSMVGMQAAELGQLIACCDVHRDHAQQFVASWEKKTQKTEKGGQCKIYSDYRELLEKEKGIEAVTIGSPDHWHVKIAIDAMKAGKHVYCEKPLTLTLEEGKIICEAVKKYGKVFQVGTQQRSEFNGCFLKAVAIARSGRLGKKLRATSSVGVAGPRILDNEFGPFPTETPPLVLDWDLWLGQAPEVPFCAKRADWTFRYWYEYSGGQVTDWGVHHTDIAFWALAGQDGCAIEAEACSSKPMNVDLTKSRDMLLGKIAPQDMPVAYNVAREFDVDIKLSTGNVIKLVSGTNELILEGEEGKIRVNRGGLTGKLVEQIDADPQAKKEIEELMLAIYGGPIPPGKKNQHMQNFFDCVASGKQPVANVRDHVRAVNACHLANIALLVGRKVQYDPTTGKFGTDAEANGLIKRPRRPAFDIRL